MINPENVPIGLRHLIPYAERFGEIDDLVRENIVHAASALEISELKQVIFTHDDALDEWLADSESTNSSYSKEYLVFTAMRMAADFA